MNTAKFATAIVLGVAGIGSTACGGGETEPRNGASADSTTISRPTTSSASIAPPTTLVANGKPPDTTTPTEPSTSIPAPATSDDPTETTSADPRSNPDLLTVTAEWPIRKKLAQLMFIGFNTGYKDTPGVTEPSDVSPVLDEGVGGVFIGRKEIALFNSEMIQDAASPDNEYPLLVATDGEGGRVDPLPQVAAPLPPAREMAELSADEILAMATSHGAELRAKAVNVNFAPMLDLEGPPNPLGDRTWSPSVELTTEKAGAFAEGMCRAGVYPTFKHFPGHGRSDYDADIRPATTPSIDELRAADLQPFVDLTSQMKGRSMVMTGHLDVPGLTEGMPLSLDPDAMRLLRDEVGFDGVAVTDELAEMGSITKRGISVENAVELSLIAGNDMALFFGDASSLDSVLDRLEEAVAEGRLSTDRVDESLRRVLILKSSKACG